MMRAQYLSMIFTTICAIFICLLYFFVHKTIELEFNKLVVFLYKIKGKMLCVQFRDYAFHYVLELQKD